MMRILLLLLVLVLAIPAVAEEAPLTFTEDLTGVYLYPEGATEADARYIYRYRYPQLAGNSAIAQLLNTTYQYTATDALGFEAPMIATSLEEGAEAMVVDIGYEITCLTDEYLSVKVTKVVTSADEVSTVVNGHVFALKGTRAGEIISLPYLLGILDDDETDEWYKDRQTQKADNCVRTMLWERLEEMTDEGVALYDGLLYEEFEACFYPEEDFYLDENGDPVFFLQENSVAEAEAGILLFPITLDELLDEI